MLSVEPLLRACGCPYDGNEHCDVHGDGSSYCGACGEYMPLSLDGTRRVHECGRTPPLGGLPPTVCVCPTCGGVGTGRLGCWGTPERPHEHVYMRPIHEVVREMARA